MAIVLSLKMSEIIKVFLCSEAAAKYKIPYTDLNEHMRYRKVLDAVVEEIFKQPKGERALSDEDEVEIIKRLRYMGEVWYMPLYVDTVSDMVKGFLKSKGRTIRSKSFKNNIPDDDWVSLFKSEDFL